MQNKLLFNWKAGQPVINESIQKHKCLPENREQVINPNQPCTGLKCKCQSVDKLANI